MNEIPESMLDELASAASAYGDTSLEVDLSFDCACGHTCQFRCEGGCWSGTAMGF